MNLPETYKQTKFCIICFEKYVKKRIKLKRKGDSDSDSDSSSDFESTNEIVIQKKKKNQNIVKDNMESNIFNIEFNEDDIRKLNEEITNNTLNN